MGTLVFQATLGGSVNLIGPNTASTINFTLPSADGTSGQALTTNGSGTLAFSTVTTGAAGSTTQVQYNSSGAFAGSANMTFDGTSLTLGGNPTLSAGTANGVTYLNGSKVLTSGSALTFDGTTVSSPVVQSTNGTITTVLSYSGGNSTGVIGTTSNHSVEFRQNNTEGMRLTSTGLGIGTSSPASKLQVTSANGAVTLDSGTGESHYIDITHKGSYSDLGGIRFNQGSTTYGNNQILFRAMDSGGTVQTVMTLNGAGNLGLGVTPSAWTGTAKHFEFGNVGNALRGGTNDVFLTENAYFSSGWKYGANGSAAMYNLSQNTHVWFTAPSGTAGNAITFTQAMTLAASGNLAVGTTSTTARVNIAVAYSSDTATSLGDVSKSHLHLGYPGFNNQYCQITFGYDATNAAAAIGYVGTSASGSTNGALVFATRNVTTSTLPTERARIDSSGNLLVGTTSLNFEAKGAALYPTGLIEATVAGSPCMNVNRLTDDGTLFGFYQASTLEGSISVSGTTVSYNGGHLSRYAQTTLAKDESIVKGTVLSNLDEMNVYTKDGQPVANEQLNKVKVSDTEGDVNVAGVFVNWSHDDAHNVDEINMAMTGDMIIRIAQGVTVVRGDLLMSAGDGTAKPQGDDIIRSKTVAKVTSNHVTCTYADGSYCVPCVLMAC